MPGKVFRELVGGLSYENPYGITPEVNLNKLIKIKGKRSFKSSRF